MWFFNCLLLAAVLLFTPTSADTTLNLTSTATLTRATATFRRSHTHTHVAPTETISLNNQSLHIRPPPVPPRNVTFDNSTTVVANTSIAHYALTASPLLKRASKPTALKSTWLVIARDNTTAYSAYSGLNDYGIPYELLIVPSTGTTLPDLNSGSTGNYGGIVVLSEVSYPNSAGSYASALTTAQWSTLYAYQVLFGARMVRLDVVPSSATGTTLLGSCCGSSTEQFLAINDTSSFPTAGLVQGAQLSTLGLYHYPGAITNSSIVTAVVQFLPNGAFSSPTVAAVVNKFSTGRQQMVFFTSFATDWSMTSVLLQHAWIHWGTRGLYAGYRRAMLNTQVDDMFLTSPIYTGGEFRVEPADIYPHIAWMKSINALLPAGSNYTIEIGHNGNGNIEGAVDALNLTPSQYAASICTPGPITYTSPTPPALEYVKPLNTGTSLWSSTSTTYNYTLPCVQTDPLQTFWNISSIRDSFSHVSHTFTHESEDTATYFDAIHEITWNQAWLKQVGLAGASRFSQRGLIPPAITGLHNGDALRAWSENGIENAVGDNTRSVLLNPNNEHWPLITTVADDNFAGIQITPRWATNLYYNCDTPACNVQEWQAIASGTGDILSLLALERTTNVRHLLGLHHDAFMFHQANLRQADVDTITIGNTTGQWSLLQMWVETVIQEFTRVVNWVVISLNHDDLAQAFANRMARDACNYTLTYNLDTNSQTITSITLSAPSVSNICSVPIPVTVPGTAVSMEGHAYEQLGSGDLLTIWVKLSGKSVSFDLSAAIGW